MAGTRCPECNKWVSLETKEPEVNSVDIDELTISTEVRVVRNCVDCDTEMKSMDFNTEKEIEDESWLEVHGPNEDGKYPEGHGDFKISEGSSSMAESGGGRYAKNMIGYDLTVTVTCKCGTTLDVEIHDEEAASFFNDEV